MREKGEIRDENERIKKKEGDEEIKGKRICDREKDDKEEERKGEESKGWERE